MGANSSKSNKIAAERVGDKSNTIAGIDQTLLDLASFSPLRVVSTYANAKEIKIVFPFAEKFPGAILFIDMSGFTPLSEKLSAKGLLGVEELSNHLNAYFGKLLEIIYMVYLFFSKHYI